MGNETGISWCDSTFNPWIGCTKVSPGCENCYASVSTPVRTGGIEWGAGKPRVRTSTENWKLPKKWNSQDFRECLECGWRGVTPFLLSETCQRCQTYGKLIAARRRVFCASLADVFDNEVDPQWRLDLFTLIEETPNLDWLLLTKRIGNAHEMLDDVLCEMSCGLTRWRDAPWPNVWIGATVVNQDEADRDIPKLLKVPAQRRFLSIEPMLEHINLEPWLRDGIPTDDQLAGANWDYFIRHGSSRIDWVICGGESGPNARKMFSAWATILKDDCERSETPFFFKQMGGKDRDKGGCLLDGKEVKQWPR